MPGLKSRESLEAISKELARDSPDATSSIARLRDAAFTSGEIPGKYKLLAAAAISVAIRCEPCIRAYVEWAARKGASKQELIEFLNVAMTMQGCPGEEWSLKALQAYNALIEERSPSEEGCCSPDMESP